mmetsp:Transcript_2396/g.7051  ORF Transcript_2396/g.7051 Transcript_2396/m.7051 type:complete len:104 (-) Transcript_2396:479-790(-)
MPPVFQVAPQQPPQWLKLAVSLRWAALVRMLCPPPRPPAQSQLQMLARGHDLPGRKELPLRLPVAVDVAIVELSDRRAPRFPASVGGRQGKPKQGGASPVNLR